MTGSARNCFRITTHGRSHAIVHAPLLSFAAWKWLVILCMLIAVAASVLPVFAQSPPPDQSQTGTITGTVLDASGAVVANAKIMLARPPDSVKTELLSDINGHFVFTSITPGPYQLSVTMPGFAVYQNSGTLQPGEYCILPAISLLVARADVDVEVTLPIEQIAEEQVKAEEKQRLFGVIPNYYMSFDPKAVPLTTRLKFQLAWKTTIDPISIALVGATAGFEQAEDAYGGYGQGAQGYAKRFGASYGDLVSGTFIGSAILPSLFKQDPRYFYKGTGSKTSRLLYAVANAVICKGDNGHWQANYSAILGGLAAGGISNLYYPAQDRNGARLTFQNEAIATGLGALGNVAAEFLFKKFTSHVPDPTQPRDIAPSPHGQPNAPAKSQPLF